MQKFELMVPWILHAEEGIKAEFLTLPNEQIYARAKARGPHNHPNDKGGWTLCGVTLDTLRSHRKSLGYQSTTLDDLRALPYGMWLDILKRMFWDRWRADEIRTIQIAFAVVDWVWTSGRYGITNVQKVLGVVADGIVGPKTLAAINGYADQRALFDKIQKTRLDYFTRISMPGTKNHANRQGWYNRLASLTWEGFRY